MPPQRRGILSEISGNITRNHELSLYYCGIIVGAKILGARAFQIAKVTGIFKTTISTTLLKATIRDHKGHSLHHDGCPSKISDWDIY